MFTKKICPLLYSAMLARGYVYCDDRPRCMEHDCAFYDADNWKCALVSKVQKDRRDR